MEMGNDAYIYDFKDLVILLFTYMTNLKLKKRPRLYKR